MISLAVLYIVNESPFMGITQVVVYTGAVMTSSCSSSCSWASAVTSRWEPPVPS